MYFLLLAILIAAGGWLARSGVEQGRRTRLLTGVGIIAGTIAFFAILNFWSEALWFHALGYGRRFWLFLDTQAGLSVIGAGLGALGVRLMNLGLRRTASRIRWWPEAIGAVVGAGYGYTDWQPVLEFANRVPVDVREPVFGLDAGFYLFTLPIIDLVHGFLVWIVVIAAVSSVFASGWQPSDRTSIGDAFARSRGSRILVVGLALAVVLGLGFVRASFHLLYSRAGVVAGPGFTDVHVRLPAYLTLAVLTPALMALVFVPGIRARAAALTAPFLRIPSTTLRACAAAWLAIGVACLLLAAFAPWLTQQLIVEPNEITLERPYIANNIALTRYAFGLSDIEERQYSESGRLTRAMIDDNRQLISEIRLWDWRALDAVYQQFQEIRLYYEFQDVDIDRYRFNGRYRQVMVSARELEQQNLPTGSQTFVNRRFKFTHGFGITLTPVSDFTRSGLPDMLVRDIPPVSDYPELEVERPEIYYGELTRTAVVANTAEAEFDYPSGEDNVYTHYEGHGGVRLGNLWRKFVFGWRFGGTPFFFSGYPDADSRVMFHRQVRERAQRIAPFLVFDSDPYIVLADGRLYWIIDAYTHSDRFPYSAPFDVGDYAAPGRDDSIAATYGFHGANFLRNSVKVVIDAYNGDVSYYVFDESDPIIRVWRNILPAMFKDKSQMPEALRGHVRYPEGMLLTQGLVYTKYHMEDPVVFYNQEDLWVRATEKHRGSVMPVEPYYVMWQLPGSGEAEFVLMMPFTPKDRQVMIGWIAGLSDGDNYGRFLAYKFPKEKRVLGPQQVESKIDQDRFLSGQLTLWDQRGSNVLRGNVLAIPLDNTLLYVEPIYLQAETAAYPELRVVVTMHGDDMSYGDTFEEALEGLFGDTSTAIGSEPPPSRLAADAQAAFERYLAAQGDARFEDAAAALSELEDLLNRMNADSAAAP